MSGVSQRILMTMFVGTNEKSNSVDSTTLARIRVTTAHRTCHTLRAFAQTTQNMSLTEFRQVGAVVYSTACYVEAIR
eukprot:scaffold166277_cov49-Attheya_sp.AAC.2